MLALRLALVVWRLPCVVWGGGGARRDPSCLLHPLLSRTGRCRGQLGHARQRVFVAPTRVHFPRPGGHTPHEGQRGVVLISFVLKADFFCTLAIIISQEKKTHAAPSMPTYGRKSKDPWFININL